MLNSEKSRQGSLVVELAVVAIVIVGVAMAVYHVQHPETTQAEQITSAIQQ